MRALPPGEEALESLPASAPVPDLAQHRHGGGHDPGESEDAEKHHLTTLQGIPAFCLDALSSVAYGPEAIALVLVAAGAAALKYTIYVSLVIVFLLAILTLSYRQVIRVFPSGGGAYAVAKASFGPTTSLLAAGSLVVDYVSAVTGVEAIANGVPAFRVPRVQRAQRTEVALGTLLGSMLLGLAFAAHHLSLRPKSSVTLLAQLTAAGLGHGLGFYVTGIAVTVILGVAANTSFAGLPVLMSLLAQDNRLPHVFALRAQKPLYRYGIVTLAVLAGVLLIAVNANTNRLLPLYAIGVFIGFTISQTGLVRHWRRERPPRWGLTAALNGFGAVLTAIATVVFLVSKFVSGAWVVTVAIPLLMLLFWRIEVYYDLAATELGIGTVPAVLPPRRSVVLVPVVSITHLTALALAAAGGLGTDVVAVSIQPSEAAAEQLRDQWAAWGPGVRLETMVDPRHTLAGPLIRYVRAIEAEGDRLVTVLIPETVPNKRRHEILHNQRGRILTALLRQRTNAVIATLPFRLHD